MPELTIPLRSHDEAILVLGPFDRFAKLMRQELDIEIFARSGALRIKGPDESIAEAGRRIEHLLGKSRKGRDLELQDIEAILLDQKRASATSPVTNPETVPAASIVTPTSRRPIGLGRGSRFVRSNRATKTNAATLS